MLQNDKDQIVVIRYAMLLKCHVSLCMGMDSSEQQPVVG